MTKTFVQPTVQEHADFVRMLEECFPFKEGDTYLKAWISKYGEDANEMLNDLAVDLLEVLKSAGFNPHVDAAKPPLQAYYAWHHLIGSSADQSTSPLLDLPAPYSIVSVMQKIKEGATPEYVLNSVSQPHEPGDPKDGQTLRDKFALRM